MSECTLAPSSILVAGLALVPENSATRYICLGLLLLALLVHVAQRQTLGAKMKALTAATASANKLLTGAPSTSATDRLLSMRQELLLRT